MSAYALILESIVYFKGSVLKSPAIQYGKALEFKCSITSLQEFLNFLKVFRRIGRMMVHYTKNII